MRYWCAQQHRQHADTSAVSKRQGCTRTGKLATCRNIVYEATIVCRHAGHGMHVHGQCAGTLATGRHANNLAHRQHAGTLGAGRPASSMRAHQQHAGRTGVRVYRQCAGTSAGMQAHRQRSAFSVISPCPSLSLSPSLPLCVCVCVCVCVSVSLWNTKQNPIMYKLQGSADR